LEIIKEITEKITQLIKDKFVIDWTTNISKTQDIEREIENATKDLEGLSVVPPELQESLK